MHTSGGGPKIINVKGITPPHSRRQSASSDEEGKKGSTLTRSTSAGTSLSGKKTPLKASLSGSKNAHLSTSELDDDSKYEVQPWNDDTALETNVLEESTNRLDISKIMNNLEKFVLGSL